MALDITAQDIIIDETTGLQNLQNPPPAADVGDDVNPSVAPHDTNTTLQYLLTLDGSGGLASPEVAFQADFVVATASAGETITSIILTQNSSGTPFSTTVGVNSGIRTVDGNYVWLFKDADPTHANVVIGVIGTSNAGTMPAPTDPLAYSFALINTSNTNADLYTVQYVPLFHPDATNPDDRIDLTDHVFASVTGTSVNNFSGQNAAPGNHDFYVINSSNDASKQLLVTGFLGANNATANVSTQGFGVNNQSINPTETLQTDFVTGGNLPAGSASQIQYGSHLDGVMQAGFTINQITPSNPNLRVDIEITALDVTGNEQGLNFYDGSPTTAAPITSLKLTGTSGFGPTIIANGTYATASGNVTVSGLGTGVVTILGLDNITTVDVTTSSQMDRLLVTGVDSNEGLDITEFHFSATSTNAHTEEVGSFINFDDDGPSISTTGTEPTLTVDETVLTTDASASFASNFSSAFGADGAGAITYALSVVAGASGLVDTATNEAVNLSLNGSVVEGRTAVSNALVFTVSVDASGNVTLDQKRAVVHANPNDPDDAATLASDDLVKLTATITDKDGDHQSATLNIGQNLVFEDDGPSISTTGTEPTLTVDETVLTTDASASFASNFSSAFGADGAGAITYALSVVAGASGLVDTATNEAVNLSLNGSVVEGRTAVSNELVFTVSVDASGNVTLDQKRAVVHANPNDPDDAATLASDDLVKLTATITDKDGDHQSATLNIGQNLVFEDDGPSISTTGTEPTLTVDETVLTTDASASFASNFSSAFGADGAGAITYALSVVAGASGLVDTATNEAVNLSLNGSVVEGRTAVSNALVFTVSVDASGNVTLDQKRAVVHANPNDPDDAATLASDDLVKLTATITDKDGDHQSATLNIGQNLVFEDDGPSISTTGTEPTLTVDETVLTTDASASFASNFSSAFGADGAGAITYALSVVAGASGLVDTATNEAVNLSLNGSVVEGRTAVSNALVFTVSVDASGNVTLDQKRAVVHANPNDPDDAATLASDDLVKLTATITDKDGDHQSATLNIGQNLVFEDDGPSISTTGTEPTLTVDETVLTTDASASFASNFSSAFGADGAGAITYALSVVAGASGLVDTATNEAVNLSLNGSVVEGRTAVSNALVFTVSVDASGNVTLDQKRAVVHANPNDPDDAATLASDDLVKLTATITDKDGDHQSATLNIGQNLVFEDDGPSISTTGTEPTLTVDETVLTTDASASFASNFSSAFGADGAGAITYALSVVAGASGLVDTATNEAVNLSLNGSVVEGRTAVSNALVFTVSVDASGNVTLDQKRAVVHANPNDPDDAATLASDDLVKLTATITDKDGDHQSATLNIGQNLVFEDDGPSISTTGTEPTLTVDETVLTTDASASFASNFSSAFGADGAGAITYALSVVAGASGLVDTATNEAVNLSLNGSVVEGRTAVSNELVFTVSVDASGNVTLDQKRAVVHANPNDPDDAATLASDDLVKLTATITDKDGDHQSATLNIGQNLVFEDDGPSISTTGTEPTLTVDETVLTTDASASFASNFSSAFGADGAGAITYALSVVAGASGLVDTATNEAVNLSLNGSVVEGRTAVSNELVFTVSVDASGNVTLDQKRAVVHANPNDPDDAATLASDDLVKLTATITDKDGDHQSATLNIGQNLVFEDDGPSISTTGTEPTLTVDETVLTTDASASFASNFSSAFGADGAGAITYALSVVAGASGLVDTVTNEAVNLSVNGGVVEGRTAVSNALVFTVSVDASGNVTLDQKRAVVHDPNNGPNDTETLTSDDLIKLTATITDKDGDHQSATLNIGQNLVFTDDAPTITAPFDADPVLPFIQTPEHLGNEVGQTASGAFGYDIGHDSHPASFYDATHSDFVDANGALAGIQIGLTGTVDNNQNPGITQAVATLTAETDTSATFNWSFHFDKDPITVGVQDSTAGGTLVFDKAADTYTFTLTDVIDGFSFDVLHTNELLAKAPTGNTGHPLIVAEQLTPDGDPNPFFVQFTANSTTQQIGLGFNSFGDGPPVGDTTFNDGGATHDMITNTNEDWVSATQATNGVAGDTIQKGEALTLRFFNENILGDVHPNDPDGGIERLDPTTSASGVVIKFDGVGNAEDLVLILDLKDAGGNEVTRAVNVQNSDLIKGNANVPFPYNTEFTLDNNDALLILESNDYNDGTETFQIQGVQIMQSANGLTGNAINLNGATGAGGDSSATSGLTAWDPTDNDVLKIVDIGFVQSTSGTIDALLDFSFAVADADGDTTATQHIPVNISNDFIVH